VDQFWGEQKAQKLNSKKQLTVIMYLGTAGRQNFSQSSSFTHSLMEAKFGMFSAAASSYSWNLLWIDPRRDTTYH